VTGTGSASTSIVTGQRLRVDGTKGTVTILDGDNAAPQVTGPGAHSHQHPHTATEVEDAGEPAHV
jgi:pyruvate,water dikinase